MTSVARIASALLAAGCIAGFSGAQAQTYPSRPVRVVVPFSPGGAADTPGRMLAPRLADALGQQVLIDNRPGAGSTIGTELVAKAAPDGYTLLLISNTHAINASLYKKLRYDPIADFAPVLQFATSPNVLVVHPSLPVKSVKELIALAKAKPGQIDYASSGNGSSQHLFTALFTTLAGIDMNHVPYKGSGQARTDLLSGQISVGIPGIASVIQHIRNGRLRALGVTGAQRSRELPDVPTIREAGVPDYEADQWLGFVAPTRTPEDAIARLNDAAQKALQQPELRRSLENVGAEVNYLGPKAFGELVKREMPKWAKVVKATGLQIN
ncbi:MAG TPA: tripartite tricarboxylate transporter substrate binding protein, partial [Burkholderiales bacterium]|jgi:tripartite-type tricarboxylate transporter receptor subunit TctC|nr:tripartite tricarboxylate transporter substrate binding protein [Burkholderiales bacterium]